MSGVLPDKFAPRLTDKFSHPKAVASKTQMSVRVADLTMHLRERNCIESQRQLCLQIRPVIRGLNQYDMHDAVEVVWRCHALKPILPIFWPFAACGRPHDGGSRRWRRKIPAAASEGADELRMRTRLLLAAFTLNALCCLHRVLAVFVSEYTVRTRMMLD